MDIKCPPNTLKTFLKWEVKSQTKWVNPLFLLHPFMGKSLVDHWLFDSLYTLLLIFVTWKSNLSLLLFLVIEHFSFCPFNGDATLYLINKEIACLFTCTCPSICL
jgi:hypothetical protein